MTNNIGEKAVIWYCQKPFMATYKFPYAALMIDSCP